MLKQPWFLVHIPRKHLSEYELGMLGFIVGFRKFGFMYQTHKCWVVLVKGNKDVQDVANLFDGDARAVPVDSIWPEVQRLAS